MSFLSSLLTKVRWPKSAAAKPSDGKAAGFPIAILSFNRPAYLRQVLESLRPQITEKDMVILFQDGAWNRWSQRRRARGQDINRCVAIFRKLIPWGDVHVANDNLGIAFNYERAERFVFEALGAEKALFLEDDLVLSRNFIAVTKQLLDLAMGEPRIGYVSAYGNLWASLDEQILRGGELLPMHENWGAALTRNSWLAERPFRLKYLELVRDSDYASRDQVQIKDFYARRGWQNKITSQDAARWISCLERQAIRLTTFACHARYIGEKGAHSTPENYRRSGFDRTAMFDGPVPAITPPSDAQISKWLEDERARFQGGGSHFYPGHGSY